MEICGEIMKKRYILLLVIIVVIIGYFAFSGGSSEEQANITGERLNVTTDDNFTWYNFDNSAPGEAGYTMSVDIGDDTYYFSTSAESAMLEYSPIFAKMFSFEPTESVQITNFFGAPVYNIESSDSGIQFFEMSVDKPFSFTYSGGHQVGYNDDAKVIEQVFDENGNEL